jgi:hypothetical protein
MNPAARSLTRTAPSAGDPSGRPLHYSKLRVAGVVAVVHESRAKRETGGEDPGPSVYRDRLLQTSGVRRRSCGFETTKSYRTTSSSEVEVGRIAPAQPERPEWEVPVRRLRHSRYSALGSALLRRGLPRSRDRSWYLRGEAKMGQDPEIAYWAPRVMRHCTPDGAVAYAIHDVYFDRADRPVSWTEAARSPRFDSPASLRSWIEVQLAAPDHGVQCGDLGYEHRHDSFEQWLKHLDEPPLDYSIGPTA